MNVVVAYEMKVQVVDDYLSIVYLNVDPDDTVRKLKLLIHDTEIMLPTYNQHLKYGGNTIGAAHSIMSFPPAEDQSLAYYGISDGAKLQLSIACGCSFFDVFVEAVVGRIVEMIKLSVTFGDTAYSVKRLIQEKTGILVDRQCLSFEGTPLVDYDNLADNGLTSCSTLDLRVAQEN